MDRAEWLSYTVIVSITRRQMLSLAAAGGLLPMRAWAQRAFPGVAYREYAQCLPDYLRDLAEAAYEARNREIAKLTSPEAIHARQRWVRETFWKLAGGEPERTPLEPQKVGSFERDGYRVEKIVYQSRPNFHIPANLYIPTSGRPRFRPFCFSWVIRSTVRLTTPISAAARGWRGWAIWCWRSIPWDRASALIIRTKRTRRTPVDLADDEHTVPGKQMLLSATSTGLQVWDAVRSLDYCLACPSWMRNASAAQANRAARR